MKTISEPGLYLDVAEDDYHRDPCPAPSLSSSIARVLIEQSPRHAWARHPRLGGAHEDEPTRQREIGSAVHKLLLGRGAEVSVIDAGDYKTGAAKEARAKCYAENGIPLLRADLPTVERMAEAAKDQLLAYPELRPLVDGEGDSEAVAVWREGDVWCRGLIDWLHPDKLIRADLKTTSASAHPQAVSSRLYGTGAEVQDRFYHRGLRALGRYMRRSLFIMLESEPPYALSVVELDDQAKDLGDEKVTLAVEMWARCLREDSWPGYVQRVAVAECPPWHVNAWNNRTLAHAALAEAERRPSREMLTELR